MHPALERLLGVLDLEARDDDGPAQVWLARHPDTETAHLFGGQVLAQGLAAARRASDQRLCHSLHAYFLQRGSTAEPIRFEVTLLRRSRAFLTLDVVARQSVGPILQMTVSYHAAEPGPTHQIPVDDVGTPAGETYEHALLQVMTPGGTKADEWFGLPVEIRTEGDLGLFSSAVNPPRTRCWMRTRGELPDDPVLHQLLFAYASDYAIFAPAVNPHPAPITDFLSASLDHAIWFHRSFRMDEWLLFDLDSPIADAARGYARGQLYTSDGRLVASCVQEALLRPLRSPEPKPA